ncbi:aminoacyl-tRNA hydrolase [uncultured Sphaerochaeta sp.]|uniref:aminoacyl-tRNA hydrolase n=1 Tax=uncultured Sphaerochaeta sp. TaxID=886478 RepID=UPI002A0A13F2|nr:aminoacyl-tRNA hydrolase [uncultured Sphaerochaeta sp.]
MKLVLGLGNPGAKYEHTRHNVGFDVVSQCAAFFQVSLRKRCFHLYRQASLDVGGVRYTLVEPLTYMNDSGKIATDFPGVLPLDMIVVCDQMDLPAGTIRIRRGGSSAGHNGLKSIISEFQGSDFIRIYVGIGRPCPGISVVDHVLSRDSDPLLNKGVSLASHALIDLIEGKSLEEVSFAYNRRNHLQ